MSPERPDINESPRLRKRNVYEALTDINQRVEIPELWLQDENSVYQVDHVIRHQARIVEDNHGSVFCSYEEILAASQRVGHGFSQSCLEISLLYLTGVALCWGRQTAYVPPSGCYLCMVCPPGLKWGKAAAVLLKWILKQTQTYSSVSCFQAFSALLWLLSAGFIAHLYQISRLLSGTSKTIRHYHTRARSGCLDRACRCNWLFVIHMVSTLTLNLW